MTMMTMKITLTWMVAMFMVEGHSVSAFVGVNIPATKKPMTLKPVMFPSITTTLPTTTTTTTKLYGMMEAATYGMRKAAFGLEDKDVLKKVIVAADGTTTKSRKNGGGSGCVAFLDVRNPDEIAQSPLSRVPSSSSLIEARYLLSSDNDAKERVRRDIPDKDGTSYIVFCAKGGRAMKACQTLTSLGYQNVYNAGGISDVLDLL